MKKENWVSYVRECLNTLIEYGTDRYGKVHTPMLMSILDVKNLVSPEEPLILDTSVRTAGRPIQRSPRGCNLYLDQPTLRAMFRLSGYSKDQRYEASARNYIEYVLSNCIDLKGFINWGWHRYYDAFDDVVKGDSRNGDYHEILVISPCWEHLWDVNPEAVKREIEAIWEWHVYDKENIAFDRHDVGVWDTGRCDFAMAGGEFCLAFCFLFAKTGDSRYLHWAQKVVMRHHLQRDRTTNLFPDCPSKKGERYDGSHLFTCCIGLWAGKILQGVEITGYSPLLDIALLHLRAYTKYGYDNTTNEFYGMLRLDGTPVMEKTSHGSYDKWQCEGYVDCWRDNVSSYEMGIETAQAYIYAYQLTGEKDMLDTAKLWADVIRKHLHPKANRRFQKELYKVLPDAEKIGGTYADNYGRAISFFVQMYLSTKDKGYLETAEVLANEAIEKLFVNGIFKGHPAKPYYEAADGVGYLLNGLLDINDAIEGKEKIPINF